jgi:two-component system, OmpR family, KDP operon response regulator KdpE
MSSRPTVLLIEDEVQLVRMLRPSLEAEGYEVLVAHTGEAGLSLLQSSRVSAIILDLGLPDMDGKEVLRLARDATTAPFLVLSAREALEEKVAALDGGAEDYLTKPFAIQELMARLRVLVRSVRTPSDRSVVTVDGATFDFARRRAILAHGEVQLSARESEFLRLLVDRQGQVVTHREIVLAIWGDLARADAQFVRVLAGQVRQKVEDDPARPRLVRTVPGIGYQIGS